MSDFKPWHRKLGILTLVMACAFMVGWVRSASRDDLFCFFQNQLLSVNGGLIWERPSQHPSLQPANFFHRSRMLNERYLAGPYEQPSPDDQWRIEWAGFVASEYEVSVTSSNGTTSIEANRFDRIPYWSIVLPLTVFSAWLLLSKPRQKSSAPKPDAQP